MGYHQAATAILAGLCIVSVGSAVAMDLEAALNYSRSKGGVCLLVERGGERLLSDYGTSGGPSADHRIYSITKNLWALAAIAAEKDGWLDLDEPASETLSEWRSSAKEKITLRQLLDMTSGLHPASARIYGSDVDYGRTAIAQPLRFRPGSGFDYGAASMEAFGEVMKRKLAGRGETPADYLSRRVLNPNGIALSKLKKDDTGHPMFSSGARATAPNLLRLGRVVMRLSRDGRGKQAFKGTRQNPGYGFTFWLNISADSWFSHDTDIEEALDRWPPASGRWRRICLAKAAPRDMITLLGSHGQRVYVVPSLDLVIVRLGNGGRFLDADFWRLLRLEAGHGK